MCIPTSKTVFGDVSVRCVRRMPQEKQSKLIVKVGDSQMETTTQKSEDAFNRFFALLLFATSLFILSFGHGFFTVESSSSRSPDELLDRLIQLKQDMDNFELLKKSFIGDEIELTWNRQHIDELQGQLSGLRSGFELLSKEVAAEEKALKEQNEEVVQILNATAEMSNNAFKLDHEAVVQLSREIQTVHENLEKEEIANKALKKLVDGKLAELSNLRGAAQKSR